MSALDAFGWSKFGKLDDKDSDDDETVPPEKKRPFNARLTWQNSKEEALVQMLLPQRLPPHALRVQFDVRRTVVEYEFERYGVQAVKLPHPAVVPKKCRWTLSERPFDGVEGGPRPCVDLHLSKAVAELWRRDTFDLGGERTGPFAADRIPQQDEPFTFEQDDDRLSLWFSIHDGVSVRDIVVHPHADRLHVDFFKDQKDRLPYASIQKDLFQAVKPDETIWMIDDVPERGRSIRIDLVKQDPAIDWADDGPFKEKCTTPTKADNASSRQKDKKTKDKAAGKRTLNKKKKDAPEKSRTKNSPAAPAPASIISKKETTTTTTASS